MFNTVYTSILPLLHEQYPSKVRFLFRQQIQPWHPSSTLVHEAGAAVLRLAPDKFWEFSAKLFERQKEYFDVHVVKETRNETYRRLAKLAGEIGVSEKEVYGLLEVPDREGEGGSANVGNKVTDDIKLMVKVCCAIRDRGSMVLVVADGCLGESINGRTCDSYGAVQREPCFPCLGRVADVCV